MVPTINMLAGCRNRGGKKGDRLKSRWLMALGQKSYYSDCPPGCGQNVGAEAVLGLLWGLVGFGKGMSVVLLSFSFIHKMLAELLLTASDAAGKPSTVPGAHGGGEGPPSGPGGAHSLAH